jgi:putative membrane-bound dehydrogenase-like protein
MKSPFSRFARTPHCTLFLAFAMVGSSAEFLSAAEWLPSSIPFEVALPESTAPLWFKCHLAVSDLLVEPSSDPKDLWRESMTLALQGIDGPFNVYLNGTLIIESSGTEGAAPTRFKVPKDILRSSVFNTLAIRFDGPNGARSLNHAPVFGGYLDEVRLDREWLVHQGEVPVDDLLPLAAAPKAAGYTANDWRPASTILQAPAEPLRGRQVPPALALEMLRPADDLTVETLLHEPIVAQPTQVSFDARGRMWIAQYRQYPYPAGLKMISRDAYYRGKYDRVPEAPPRHTPGADVISVHEDTDGDGIYDHHKVVLTELNLANSALHGHGGIWVTHAPYLLFFPDADGDDVPDGPPEVRLAGFGFEDTHSTVNGLAWGPDGWLYGAQGSTVSSHITRPDVDQSDETPLYLEGCAVWRYHPQSKQFEIFADGSGNTFGLHFDAEGRLFTGHNGGDTRGWHHVQDGIYLKQGLSPDKFGPPTNPYSFGELDDMPATHPIARFSHQIIMVEGNALPERWQNLLLGADPLHRKITASKRTPVGSTFSTTDVSPALETDDITFRPVYLTNSPDGSITIADFREEYIAHGQNYQGQIDPASGRIYRLRGKDKPLEKNINLGAKTNGELIELLSHPNLWHRQTAVRLLAERHAAIPDVAQRLQAGGASAHPALEIVWVLHQTRALDESLALQLLKHPSPMVRAWTIRLCGDGRRLSPRMLESITTLCADEPDPEVRSQILSTSRRLSVDQALPLVAAILSRDVDGDDLIIPLMIWFTLESHCAASAEKVIGLFENQPALWSRNLVRRHITSRLMRRFAAAGTRGDLIRCATLLSLAPTPEDRAALMIGFEQAFEGRSLPVLPVELAQALANQGSSSLPLRLRQRDPAALEEALAIVADPNAPAAERARIARIFGEILHPPAMDLLLSVAVDVKAPPEVANVALAALSAYDETRIGEKVAASFSSFPPNRQDAALALLASRPAWAMELLRGIEQANISRSVVPQDQVARLHDDPSLREKLAVLFPAQAPSARESFRPKIDRLREVLAAAPGDPYAGEEIYMQRCAACHKLFHKGGDIGPNLTSYQRADLSTMLVSIVDPNAEIREGYGNHIVTTKDGRVLSGFLTDQDQHAIVLRGFDGNDTTISRDQILESKAIGLSLMPEGLLDSLDEESLRNLFAYLRISQPISQ